ncbi:MAG: glycosyltransferase [Actinobacteria bacterium]|nr:glycosyltransferase [Actinomycetota bacterium]
MATYNGSAYLREQLDSILAELRPDDEVVIVDDASPDDTVSVIESYDDPRIRLFRNEQNRGYVRSFERAMNLATGEVLLLSDQDDVWIPGRRDALVAAASATGVAASNLLLLGSEEPLRSPLSGRPWLLRSADSARPMRNELRILAGDIPYFGCAMAIHRGSLGLVLPFPEGLTESHDLWIATVANAARRMTHLEQATLYRRVHEENASSSRPRGLRAALGSRLLLLRLWRLARRRARQIHR